MYTIEEYQQAIDRELKKRETAYPKLLTKFRRETFDAYVAQHFSKTTADVFADRDTRVLAQQQSEQNYNLLMVKETLTTRPALPEQAILCLAELKREMKMRQKVYSFLVCKKRMEAEVAGREKKVWKALVTYYKTFHSL